MLNLIWYRVNSTVLPDFYFAEGVFQMPKMAVVSLGCSKNLVDTEIMLGRLVDAQWELTLNFEEAALILVNTCGFIETAKKESIEQILEMARYKLPDVGQCQKLVVAGCLVQRYRRELGADIPEVDHWIGLQEVPQIAGIIAGEVDRAGDAAREPSFLNNQNFERYRVTLKHTAFLKIAEGCNHRCAYCAIPIIKGGFHSRNPGAILSEAVALVRTGVKELNIIAQDITMYGADLANGFNLRILLEEIISKARPDWIRLLYAYPSGITEELLQLIRSEPTICKYLDIPLQHINGRLLKLMNRPDSPEFLRDRLRLIRETVPGMTLRTTFITGFPSETDEEFAELQQFVEEGHFEHVGAFAYSREEQTVAYRLPDQISDQVKEARQQQLLNAQQGISRNFLAELVQKQEPILVDRILADGKAIGRTQALAPEVDGVVYLQGFHGQAGEFVSGIITGSDSYNLFARPV